MHLTGALYCCNNAFFIIAYCISLCKYECKVLYIFHVDWIFKFLLDNGIRNEGWEREHRNVHAGMYIAIRIYFIIVLFWIFPLPSQESVIEDTDIFPPLLSVGALAQWRQRHEGVCLWQPMGSCILSRNAQTL